MKARLQWLLHPIFLICVALLLLNDLYLKYLFHNWVTGKLSDITGLIAFTIAGYALLNTRKWVIVVIVAFFFGWWKSPLSEPVIVFFNTKFDFQLYRVVDYSDYFALCFLPLTALLKRPEIGKGRLQHMAITGSGLISFIAFCATTGPYQRWYEYYRKEEIAFPVMIKTKKTDKEILYALDPQRKGWRIDSVRYLPHVTDQRPYYLVQQPGDSIARWVPLPDSLPVPMYYKQITQPFYIIPEYVLDGDTLFALEFSIENPAKKENKRLVSFRSFRSNDKIKYNAYLSDPLFRKYRQHFKKLLRGN